MLLKGKLQRRIEGTSLIQFITITSCTDCYKSGIVSRNGVITDLSTFSKSFRRKSMVTKQISTNTLGLIHTKGKKEYKYTDSLCIPYIGYIM